MMAKLSFLPWLRFALSGLMVALIIFVTVSACRQEDQKLQSQLRLQAELQKNITQLHLKQNEFSPGSQAYTSYASWQTRGLLMLQDPDHLKKIIRDYADQSGLTINMIGFGQPQRQSVQGETSLTFVETKLVLSVDSASDANIFALLDLLPTLNCGLFIPQSIDIKKVDAGLKATIIMNWQTLENAPQLENLPDAKIQDVPAPGKSLFTISSSPETTAFVLKVERTDK